MSDWPYRGRELGDWLVEGADAVARLLADYGSRPAPDSVLRHDELTLTSVPKVADAGTFSVVLALGAAELLKGLGTMVRHAAEAPVTRAHLPVVRSIQEHVGQMMWLLNAGTVNVRDGQPVPVASEKDDRLAFQQRTLRAHLLHWKSMDDACQAACLSYGEHSTEHREAVEQRREAARRVVDLGGATTDYPGPTAFAAVPEDAYKETIAHLVTDPDQLPKSNQFYAWLCNTVHGGLYGLLVEGLDEEHRVVRFRQNDDRVDGVACRVGVWWGLGTRLLAEAHGWDWDSQFSAFDRTMRSLFDD